jgi:hypothetical protein
MIDHSMNDHEQLMVLGRPTTSLGDRWTPGRA